MGNPRQRQFLRNKKQQIAIGTADGLIPFWGIGPTPQNGQVGSCEVKKKKALGLATLKKLWGFHSKPQKSGDSKPQSRFKTQKYGDVRNPEPVPIGSARPSLLGLESLPPPGHGPKINWFQFQDQPSPSFTSKRKSNKNWMDFHRFSPTRSWNRNWDVQTSQPPAQMPAENRRRQSRWRPMASHQLR